MRKIGKYFIAVFILSAVLQAVLSCKKDDDDSSTKSYLSGTLTTGTNPPFAYWGDSMTFILNGVSYPSTDKDTTHTLGVYYIMTPGNGTIDTVFYANSSNPYKPGCKFSIELPDTLTDVSILISVYPSADDLYYTSSATVTVTTVDDLQSIPEISPYKIPGIPELYVDPRDESTYACVKAGGNVWMNRNLSYVTPTFGRPYEKCMCMSYVFGGYYTWTEAQTACPEGWKLPSSADFDSLKCTAGDLMADAYFNKSLRLWEYWPAVKITNKYFMSFISAGYCNPVNSKFDGTVEYASFWTSDTEEAEVRGEKTTFGIYRYVYVEDNDLKKGLLEPDAVAMSVRCIKK